MANTLYANVATYLEEIQRLPEEAQKAILTMLRGAVVISDMYVAASKPAAKEDG